MRPRVLTEAEIAQRRVAAVKHGAFAKHPANLQRRDYRSGRLLGKLQAAMGEDWPEPADLPVVKLYCKYVTMAEDALAASQADPDNMKLAERALSAGRVVLQYARELGLTPAERGHEPSSSFYAR
jgi:hypothetical protein